MKREGNVNNIDVFQASVSRWRIVFIMSAVIYVVGALFYTVFGSGKQQHWDNLDIYKSEETIVYVHKQEREPQIEEVNTAQS